MTGINCHFVSRFATTPWEFGQRRLWYFDFKTSEVRETSSRSLFAVQNENTEDVEHRLNEIIESPLSKEIASWQPGVPPTSSLDWPLFRAVVLLMMLQPIRSSANPERAARLEEIVMRPDAELDGIARVVSERYHLGRISVAPEVALLYPSAGYFRIPVEREDDYWELGVAIPVGLHHVMVAIPRTVDWEATSDLWAENGSARLANSSVGDSDKVLLPPAHRAAYDDAEIATFLREMREQAQSLIALCRDMNGVLARMDAL